MKTRLIGALIVASVLGLAKTQAQDYTNGTGEKVGAPAIPAHREPPSPQTPLIITNDPAVVGAVPAAPSTNRSFPPALNRDRSGNLKGGAWFYPEGTNGYRRGTFLYQRGTNGFYRVVGPDQHIEFVPDAGEVYRPDSDGIYRHYIIRDGGYVIDTNGILRSPTGNRPP